MSNVSIKMLADSLWVLRKYLGKTQAELSEELGISQSYLSEIERGDKEVTLAVLQKYSDKFNIPLSSILFFAESEGEKISGSGKRRRSIALKTLKVLRGLLPKEMRHG